jgi:CRISPR-associated endonuclease/helicase Cas3
VADIEGLRADDVAGRNGKRPFLEWRGGDESVVRWKPEEIRPGAMIVVPAEYGGCDEWGWNPESPAPVDDIGDAVKLQMGRPMLRLQEALAEKWGYRGLAAKIREAESAADARAVIAEALDQNAEPWVRDVAKEMSKGRPRLAENPVDRDTWAAIIGKAGFDQGSLGASYTVEIPLDQHLRGCAGRAQTFASGLPDRVRQTIIRAAEFHDIGKSDPRFQAWLRGGVPVKPNELIAKSGRSGQNPSAMERARSLAGYPKGGRHELMSVALLASHEPEFADVDFDLLLHLIASHHGRCRPFAPVVEDGDSAHVIYKDWSAQSDHRLDRACSGISERFWRLTRRYGWYGLSFLETLVRLADQRESEEEREDKVAEAARA